MFTPAEEAIIVEFRRRTLLPLDDVIGCLKDTVPKPTRSALHRCLLRHGISRLLKDEEASSKRKAFKETRIGYVHIDSAQFRSAEGKIPTTGMATGGAFIRNVIGIDPSWWTP